MITSFKRKQQIGSAILFIALIIVTASTEIADAITGIVPAEYAATAATLFTIIVALANQVLTNKRVTVAEKLVIQDEIQDAEETENIPQNAC